MYQPWKSFLNSTNPTYINSTPMQWQPQVSRCHARGSRWLSTLLAQSEAGVRRPSLLWTLVVLLRILAVELPFSSYVTRLFQALIQQNTQEFLMCRSTSGNKHEFSTELEQRGTCRVHAHPLASSLSLCSCKQIELTAPPCDIVPACLRFIVRKGGVSFFTFSRLKTLWAWLMIVFWNCISDLVGLSCLWFLQRDPRLCSWSIVLYSVRCFHASRVMCHSIKILVKPPPHSYTHI